MAVLCQHVKNILGGLVARGQVGIILVLYIVHKVLHHLVHQMVRHQADVQGEGVAGLASAAVLPRFLIKVHLVENGPAALKKLEIPFGGFFLAQHFGNFYQKERVEKDGPGRDIISRGDGRIGTAGHAGRI